MKDAAHLLRLAGLFAVGIVLFLLIRRELVPAGFGEYGFFRPAAMDAVRARPMIYAGRTTCEMCHEGELKLLQSGKHAHVGLCPVCHEVNSAKPKGFPQVVAKEHSGGAECTTCHNPHRPLPVGRGAEGIK